MVITFCGHRDVQKPQMVKAWLNEVVEGLILEGASCFYLGGCGQFDALAAAVVQEQKKQYPQICSVLVLPYLDRPLDAAGYDERIYPPLENVPRRFAIVRRNEYMVDMADAVIAFVVHRFGGAYRTLCYAKRKHKRVIQYTVDKDAIGSAAAFLDDDASMS